MNTRVRIARYFADKSYKTLKEVRNHQYATVAFATIELQKVALKEAYDALGQALDELEIQRLKPEHCKHPEDLRERINASTDRCKACGSWYAMYAGRTSVYRKWLPPNQMQLAQDGAIITEALLSNSRRKVEHG